MYKYIFFEAIFPFLTIERGVLMSFSAMFYKKVFTFITLQFVFIPFFADTVKAEGEDYMQNYPKEYLQKLSEELKLPLNSRHFKKIFSNQEEDGILPEEKYHQKIIKHIKGSSGERFATEEEVFLSFLKYGAKRSDSSSSNNTQSKEDESEEIEQDSIFNKEELLDLTASLNKNMPICSKSITEQVKKRDKNIKPTDEVIFDFIVLNPYTPLPEDLEKAFGKNIIIVTRTDGEDILSQILLDNNVTCLPARIRATEKVMFIDQGLNALKNYDQNFYGRGVLDKKVLEKMKIQ